MPLVPSCGAARRDTRDRRFKNRNEKNGGRPVRLRADAPPRRQSPRHARPHTHATCRRQPAPHHERRSAAYHGSSPLRRGPRPTAGRRHSTELHARPYGPYYRCDRAMAGGRHGPRPSGGRRPTWRSPSPVRTPGIAVAAGGGRGAALGFTPCGERLMRPPSGTPPRSHGRPEGPGGTVAVEH